MQSKLLATEAEFPTILVPKPQLASNRVPLRESRCRPVSGPEAQNASEDSIRAPAYLQRKNLWHEPAFAIGLMAGDGNPEGTQDRMVPCAAAKHQFTMANIMNRLDAYPFTRGPKPNSEYCRRTGLGGN